MQVQVQIPWWRIVVALFFLIGLGLRVLHATTLPEFSFQDGARDVLVAKRLIAGQVGWEVAPASAGIIPNTPLPYWITTFWYALAGVQGVLMWHILAGSAVMVIAYVTGRLIADKQSGLVALVVTAFSPELIRLSQIIWPTHAFVAIYALGLYVSLLALHTHQLKWYWWAALCGWIIQMLHSSELLLVLVLEVVLGWSLWKLMQQKRIDLIDFKKWQVTVVLSWVVWLLASFGLVGRFALTQSSIELQQLPLFSWSLKEVVLTLVAYGRLTTRFVSFVFYWQFWLLVALAWLAIGIQRKRQSVQQSVGLYRLLWLLFGTIAVVVFGPTGIVSSWYVSFHSYVVVLLVSTIPYLISRTKWQQYLLSGLLLALVLGQNWFWLVGHLRYSAGTLYADSEQIASKINADIHSQKIEPTHVSILVFEAGDEGSDYRELAERWHTSSIQLALESLDPVYVRRVSVVPWADHWSNYVQPLQDVYYVVCPITTDLNVCVHQLSWSSSFDAELVSEFVASNSHPLAIYRVTVLPAAIETGH